MINWIHSLKIPVAPIKSGQGIFDCKEVCHFWMRSLLQFSREIILLRDFHNIRQAPLILAFFDMDKVVAVCYFYNS